MKSPFKRILVYDLETGGLNHNYNSVTEVAIVAIDLEELEIVDEFSTMVRPHFELSYLLEGDSKTVAKTIFKNIATRDDVTKIKTLNIGSEKVTLKNISPLIELIDTAKDILSKLSNNSCVFSNDFENIFDEFGNLKNIVFDNTYNPQALDVTKITKDMLNGGEDVIVAVKSVSKMISKHTVGNSKPILAGHNIKSFDNKFFEKFLALGGVKMSSVVNTNLIDTLEWARMMWTEMPNYTLSSCANEVGLTLEDAHRAINDTKINAKFLVKMLKNLRGEGTLGKKTYVRKKYTFNF